MNQPLNKESLDATCLSGCGQPGCTHSTHTFYVHSKCHPGGACEVSYTHNTGVIRVVCAVCKKPITEVAVASQIHEQAEEQELTRILEGWSGHIKAYKESQA